MALVAGTRLGPYEIVAPLGAGGMGEVYRARDTKLGRDVAIKVLPDGLARDPERLRRFEREARVLAALSHPAIAGIYGLEESGGVPVLVLELVEGPTLDVLLAKGPRPQRETLDLARQIAEALGAAHEKGIIHRDLKPANVMLTSDGRIKLLDFGLAKAFDMDDSDSDSKSPTTTGTAAGTVLGTPAYMSPEQARGQELDKRTDIWSFGCLLYEMLTGRRAFGGGTASDTIAAILEREPDWGRLPPAMPAALASLLRRCLQKDRLRRLQDVGDARIEIEELLAGPSSSASAGTAATSARSRRGWALAALLGSLLVTLGAAAWIVRVMKRSPAAAPTSLTRLNIQLPTGVTIPFPATLAVAPDAKSVVFTGRLENRPQLFIRRLDQISAKAIAGTEGGDGPFFSPDGKWLGFWSDAKLKKIPLEGGEPKIICDAPRVRGASWGPDDTILFGGGPTGLSVVAASGGATPRALTTPDSKRGQVSHRWPHFLPGGREALFSTMSHSARPDEGEVAVVTLETGKWRLLLKGGSSPRYVATGHLLYGFQGSLWAAPFDLKKLEVTGPSLPVLEGVSMASWGNGSVALDVASGGSLVYVAGELRQPEGLLQWVGRQGKTELVTSLRRPYQFPRISPDGRRVAVVITGVSDDELSVYDLTRDTWTRLAASARISSPVWSPDGRRVAFSSNRNGAWNLFWAPADGTGEVEQLTQGQDWSHPASFAPDGSVIAFDRNRPGENRFDIELLPLSGDRTPRSFLLTPSDEGAAAFSPNGRWIAYQSDETGRYEVYVRPYPGPGGKRTLSTDGGTNPVWKGDRELLYLQRPRKVMAVGVRTDPDFRAEAPRMLFEASFDIQAAFDAAPGHQRLIAVQEPETAAPTLQLVVIPDWLAGLERRLHASPGSR